MEMQSAQTPVTFYRNLGKCHQLKTAPMNTLMRCGRGGGGPAAAVRASLWALKVAADESGPHLMFLNDPSRKTPGAWRLRCSSGIIDEPLQDCF